MSVCAGPFGNLLGDVKSLIAKDEKSRGLYKKIHTKFMSGCAGPFVNLLGAVKSPFSRHEKTSWLSKKCTPNS